MEVRYLIQPDTEFVREVIDHGGESLKNCFQCGTCSVVCSLSPAEKPFPRKEMIWVQWGLKDRLLKDPDVWLCHQCTDCSTRCPRGAKPGDVLAAIRSYSIGYFSRPRFLAKAYSAPQYLPALLAIPALLIFAFFWLATGNLAFPEGIISPEDLIPSSFAYTAMSVLFIFVFIVAGSGIYRFWKSISKFEISPVPTTGGGGNWLKTSFSVLVDILKHSKFDKCEENKVSRYTHLAIFYGAILLLIATALSAIFHHFLGIYSPHLLTSPVKIAGNLGALLLLVGCLLVIFRRLSSSDNVGKTAYADWFLIWVLFFTNLTGIATEVIRLADLAAATYWLYLVHLWLMFVFFISLPFSKAAHMIYRTVALAYARKIGRVEG
ncbi:quinone-interacting membrane-bound oxidoreductase complex subunit QmoC [Chloroflexota bacterium]